MFGDLIKKMYNREKLKKFKPFLFEAKPAIGGPPGPKRFGAKGGERMKKIYLIVLACLILGGGGGYLAWKSFSGKAKPTSSASPQTAGSDSKSTSTSEFMWGVDVNPAAIGNYNLETWNLQLYYVSALNTNWIRLAFDNDPANKFTIFDEMIEAANAKGIDVFLGIGSTKPILDIKDTYKDGNTVGKEIATHYKGKIKYYQLMSEQGSTALKGSSYSGEKESDYDKAKYEKVREWMKGASAAIRKVDPNAKLVITDQWTHTAYLDMLARDKVDYDIIGWDWYSGMGPMGERKLANGTLLVDKLKSFNKPIILAEVNFTPDPKTGQSQQDQSDFIKTTAEWAYNSGYIKGFYVFKLVDYKPTQDNPNDCCALIKFKSVNKFGDKRQAFDTYAEIIKKYSK